VPATAADLPAHFRRDYSDSARAILQRFGVSVDLFS